MSRELDGVGVLITRPAAQAGAQVRLVEARGGQPVPLPLQAIEATVPPPNWQQAPADVVIFTSVNAVAHAGAWGVGGAPVGRLLAAGAATRAALAAAGFGAAEAPAGADGSEGLLVMHPLVNPAGLHILIVTGENPRAWLGETLRKRGAQVQVAGVYRRVAVAHPASTVRSALEASLAAILTNGEGLARLVSITPGEARARLLALQLVVPSDRVAEEARRLGFLRAALAPRHVGDEALVDCLGAWRRNLMAPSS